MGDASNVEILETLDGLGRAPGGAEELALERAPEVAERAPGRLGPPVDVQSLWFASSAKPWRSLALVPASPELDLRKLSEDLVETATRAGVLVRLLDARELTIEQVPYLLERLAEISSQLARVLVVLPPPSSQPAARALLEASDSFLIFVPLDELSARSLQQLVELCPTGRGLGAVAVHRRTGRS